MNPLNVPQVLIDPCDRCFFHVGNCFFGRAKFEHSPFDVDDPTKRMTFVDCVIAIESAILQRVREPGSNVAAIFDSRNAHRISNTIKK